MKRMLPWIAALMVLAPGAASAAPKAVPFSMAENPCTSKETWTFGPAITKAFRDKLGEIPSGKKAAVESFIVGYAVKLVSKNPEVTTLGEYYMYRAFFELNLLHFAEHGFASILTSPPNPATTGIKIAALACQNQMHRKFPSLGVAEVGAGSLGAVNFATLTDEQRDTIWEAMATAAGRKLFNQGREAKIGGELYLLKGSGAYETFVQSIQAMTQERDDATIFYTDKFLKYPSLPESLKSQLDGAHLNLARAYYHMGKYEEAVKEFKKVKPASNFYSRSLLDAAWAQLMLKNYSDAAGSAFNLLVGSLRKTFAPDASIIIAMSQFENCHVQEARETLAYFKRNYDKSYRWLYAWNAARKKQQVSLYPLVAEFLKSGQGAPAPLASEWIRSPVFIAEQQELNLLFDEEEAAKKLNEDIQVNPKSSSPKLRAALKSVLAHFIERIPGNKRGVMEKIDNELTTRNQAMVPALVEAFETAQLIEVEIYNQAGEELIRKKGAKGKELAQEPAKPKKYSDGDMPVLDWGRAPAGDSEDNETWDDELGAVKTEVTNLCKKK